ncbi:MULTISPECIES: BspA family leucine-rich repeat surface protein [unclassified Flavobacterium]|uniref:BspA family leucine-rich repeat surface protein n=1 Tax=unclassified Flavobacterium TaxID=196869 RepID=UPI0012AA4FC7|nr:MULTISPECIES: BspA family leucine-rich repeat surface protein [unclassified Flavobacterium]MBF4484370.1 DUF285 domain-containing protein [Flavobacterium sp. CSZ]QGK72797.1 BspA family leucine-rich repeat surface protein [Flavobacterium sp. SLB02]
MGIKKYVFGKRESEKEFVSTWKTDNISTGSSAENQIKLPLQNGGVYNFIVDWGDGTKDTITSWNQSQVTHTYSLAGIYKINITGICYNWAFLNTGDRLKLLNILSWGNLRLGNRGYYFQGCSNLDLSKVSDILDTTVLTNMEGAFYLCTNLTTVNRMNEWNFSKITNTSFIFYGASQFNQAIRNWNTSQVTNMNLSFFNAKKFNQNIGSWDTSNVTTMTGMFQSADAFNQNISSWNVSKVTNMSNLFFLAYSFNNGGNPDINNWITSSVTNMGNMFFGTNTFNQPIGNWDVSKVTLMNAMFQGALIFNQDISSWDVSNVTNMAQMFQATSFNQQIGNWDVSRVTLMNGMFVTNNSFNQNIGNWNILNVTNMTNFMGSKIGLSATNLDAIYNGWSSKPVKPNLNISFGTAKHTANSTIGKMILQNSPYNWTITDGGI